MQGSRLAGCDCLRGRRDRPMVEGR